MYGIIFTGYEMSSGLERVSGAYRLATVLRQQSWDIEVVDFFYLWTLEQLKTLIKSRHQQTPILFVGFSATWINYSSALVQQRVSDLVAWLAQHYPSIVTIAGGQNANFTFPMYQDIQYLVNGYGEVAMVQLLRYIYGSGSIQGVPRKRGWYIDANAFYPAWPISDLSIDYQARDFIHTGETLSLEFSRGCKFACTFCNFPILGVKEDTTRDLGGLAAELKRNYDQWGITNYQVADETLNDRDEKLEKIGSLVETLGFQPNFNAFIRADILFSRPQQLELLARAGVWGHYYGIETMNHDTGKIVGKGMQPQRIQQGLIDTRHYFQQHLGRYRGTVSLIYGLPKETPETIRAAWAWFEANWQDQSVLAFPLNFTREGEGKQSQLDQTYQQHGYEILGRTHRDALNPRYNFFSTDLTVWRNPHMDLYEAIDLVTQQKQQYQGTIDSWKLWSLAAVGPFEQLMHLEAERSLTEFYSRAKLIKLKYIESKLAI